MLAYTVNHTSGLVNVCPHMVVLGIETPVVSMLTVSSLSTTGAVMHSGEVGVEEKKKKRRRKWKKKKKKKNKQNMVVKVS